MTLAFLGQVDEPTVARLLPRLERAARRHRKLSRLAFAGAGAFPAVGRANVLWSGLSGDRGPLARWPSPSPPALAALAARPEQGAPVPAAPDPGPVPSARRCHRARRGAGRLPGDSRGQRTVFTWSAVASGAPAADGQPRYVSLASWPLRAGLTGTPAAGGQLAPK